MKQQYDRAKKAIAKADMLGLPIDYKLAPNNEVVLIGTADTSITEYAIPNFITRIDKEAFRECRNLKSIEVPDSVREIQSCAFEECHSLERVSLPNGLKKIGYKVFYGCCALNEIRIRIR
ncbi:MAG: Fibronectin type domain [Herbinix sp.]|jgi:hypothetical protein|nr:Fibronectin type domain [Herbinix sp.]